MENLYNSARIGILCDMVTDNLNRESYKIRYFCNYKHRNTKISFYHTMKKAKIPFGSLRARSLCNKRYMKLSSMRFNRSNNESLPLHYYYSKYGLSQMVDDYIYGYGELGENE